MINGYEIASKRNSVAGNADGKVCQAVIVCVSGEVLPIRSTPVHRDQSDVTDGIFFGLNDMAAQHFNGRWATKANRRAVRRRSQTERMACQIACFVHPREKRIVTIELLHTAFGVLFTFVWLFVGQIIVASR